MKKYIELALFVYKDLIFGKVLHTDERLINNFAYYNNDLDFNIYSMICPDIFSTKLFLQGSSKSDDDIVFSSLTKSKSEAVTTFRKVIVCMNIINKMSFTELSKHMIRREE